MILAPRLGRMAGGAGGQLRRAMQAGGGLLRPVSCSAAAAEVELRTLEDLAIDSSFTRELPGDESTENRPRQVYNAFWSRVDPTPADGEPTTVLYSADVARTIGLDPNQAERPEFAAAFSGAALLPRGAGKAYAACYGGHQFGHWAGQLGDGRAIVLGEVAGAGGEGWELQLKGAGRTPYSRFADGRAVLRSSVREFLASEAMAAMGIPTTRALSLVATGDAVLRDMFYDGRAREEPGAVVCRVSRSFVRFGSLQLPALRGEEQAGLVRVMADYVIRHHYPHLSGGGGGNQYAALLREVCERTGSLVSGWHCVGFTHGVLNTDNMSILGETIDYGPYAFIERYDPAFTPNTTDLPGRRYSFGAQPQVGSWNCAQLANAMLAGGLMDKSEAEEAVECYGEALATSYARRMASKLGLATYRRDVAAGLMQLMRDDATDFTNTFRSLSGIGIDPAGDEDGLPPTLRAAVQPADADRAAAWAGWVELYRAALREEGMGEAERAAMQNAANPVYVPRNHVMVAAIAAAERGDYAPLRKLYAVLQRPFEEQDTDPSYREPAPLEARLGVELLSCSS